MPIKYETTYIPGGAHKLLSTYCDLWQIRYKNAIIYRGTIKPSKEKIRYFVKRFRNDFKHKKVMVFLLYKRIDTAQIYVTSLGGKKTFCMYQRIGAYEVQQKRGLELYKK